MLKQKPRDRYHNRKLSQASQGSRRSINTAVDSENINPPGKSVPFNTKGYFSPSQPYAEDYLKAKQEVFKKYRNTNQELVVIDPKMTKPAIYIHKGLLKPNNTCINEGSNTKQKVINNFIKNYMSRKEKRQQIECERYFGGSENVKRRESTPSISANIDNLYPTISVKSSRPATKPTVSRIPTSRSNFSNKEN